ncbi:expressed protein [Dictyostelium purpureum]|uniref:Expressed protein n=1 Tax=Dictyostelium purpureum TaxID=5786 RepID=F0ZDQ5_DICPU|nr:uncharacterized protein DICPUDRAFT_149433 [Dictyostelium purpureum]EGC37908.1 expressed protein [Dictyostelium purpureum]|eukprot:XP_003285568.1 expressed protein [Dictyostelium purpureum]
MVKKGSTNSLDDKEKSLKQKYEEIEKKREKERKEKEEEQKKKIEEAKKVLAKSLECNSTTTETKASGFKRPTIPKNQYPNTSFISSKYGNTN